jgi:hypothetical protein
MEHHHLLVIHIQGSSPMFNLLIQVLVLVPVLHKAFLQVLPPVLLVHPSHHRYRTFPKSPDHPRGKDEVALANQSSD